VRSRLRWGRQQPSGHAEDPVEADLICSVSTVKDSPANLSAFVERNLRAGVDHMFIFLEGSEDDIASGRSVLGGNPHVTVVPDSPAYWTPRRPNGLNQRQVINANLVNTLLCLFPRVAWLFHIDGDECLDIDRTYLATVPDDVDVVRLQTREAVSQQHWDREVDRFKRLLNRQELCLLSALGVISAPANGRYFNGHLAGKPGVRPDPDLRLRIHKVVDGDGEDITPHVSPDALHVLHYESYSGEEFVRKWMAHLTSGSTSKFSAAKDQLRGAVAAVLANPVLTEDAKQEVLGELYRRKVEDDLPTLERLGLLVQVDPAHHQHTPAEFTPEEAKALQQLLRHMTTVDKRCFAYNDSGRHPLAVLADLRGNLGADERDVARRIDKLLSDRDKARQGTVAGVPSQR
jgi:hypothetical protein